MSGKTEMVYEPDTDIDIEEFKHEPTDSDEDAMVGREDMNFLNTDQIQSIQTCKSVKKRNNKDVLSCDQCEYAGTRQALRNHKKSKHEGIRYPCDQCDYAATRRSDLKKHKESEHGGIKYPCDQCEYAALAYLI